MADCGKDLALREIQALLARRDSDDARFRALETGQAALQAGQAALEAGQAALRDEVARLNAEIDAIRGNTAEQIQRELHRVWAPLASMLEGMLPACQLSVVRVTAMELIDRCRSLPSQA